MAGPPGVGAMKQKKQVKKERQMEEWIRKVRLREGFWKQQSDKNREITMRAVWDRFADTGRIGAFRCDWKEGMRHKPDVYWDSDVAKWMEAAAYLLGKEEIPWIRERLEWLIDRIEENQEPCGYFNTHFMTVEPGRRFTDQDAHELYCAGHLMEAAAAYRECCGETRFLNAMCRYADYIYEIFYVQKSAAFSVPGHEEIELALIRLYRMTGERRYLELGLYFLNTRGTVPPFDRQRQNHLPVRSQKTAQGHCVRALYLYTAMADAARETEDEALHEACRGLFLDITRHKMYLTGGVGSTYTGECFTENYDLPNETAYAETCASIAMILFCERMLRLEHSSVYADVIERELYNGMLSGISLNGKAFFYENPLEITLAKRLEYDEGMVKLLGKVRLPITQRQEVFTCSCCPPNLSRTLASLERLLYSVEGRTVCIHQFADSELSCGGMTVRVKTDYPVSGRVEVSAAGTECILIRIPGWCRHFSIDREWTMENGYACVKAEAFTVEFDMTPEYRMANENVWEDAGKAAVMRGPVVYCAEGLDQEESLHKLWLDTGAAPEEEDSEYFGLPILKTKGWVRRTGSGLYEKWERRMEETEITLIPYYGFANRGETDMRVWMNALYKGRSDMEEK